MEVGPESGQNAPYHGDLGCFGRAFGSADRPNQLLEALRSRALLRALGAVGRPGIGLWPRREHENGFSEHSHLFGNGLWPRREQEFVLQHRARG